MKHIFKMWMCAGALAAMTSCADNSPLDFQVDKPESIVLQDSLNAYRLLKTYVDTIAKD